MDVSKIKEINTDVCFTPNQTFGGFFQKSGGGGQGGQGQRDLVHGLLRCSLRQQGAAVFWQ